MVKIVENFKENSKMIQDADEKAKKSKKEITVQREKLFGTWKEEWEAYISSKNGIEREKYQAFLEMFEGIYQYANSKSSYNGKMNFRMKKIFMTIFIVASLLYFGLVIWSVCKVEDSGMLLAYNLIILVAITICVGAFGKWIDIKKYQETWSRHDLHQYLLDQEILLFLYRIEPYNGTDKETQFIKYTIQIWESNQKKFSNNLEQKEKELMDIFNYFGLNVGQD